MNVMESQPKTPYFAVIFTNQRTAQDEPGYLVAAQRMVELASQQPGFLGIHSVRNADGVGITISYWSSMQAIRNWKQNAEHLVIQRIGKEKWYEWFDLRIAKVESGYGFQRQ